MDEELEKSIAASAARDARQSEPILEVDTRELLGERREATIIHAGERYRLRITSNNKLILTK
ncbi:MAG: hemin uptake protein HemP [Methylocystis sp.]|uniref:hemin uptake protein HemP n=1 Tax=Methylocystis sp. TaxID=1911079 RepID=UPI0039505879